MKHSQGLTIWHTRPKMRYVSLTPWLQDSKIIEFSIKMGINWHDCSFRTFSFSDRQFLAQVWAIAQPHMKLASDFWPLKKQLFNYFYCINCICVNIDPKSYQVLNWVPISLDSPTCPPPRMADLPKTQCAEAPCLQAEIKIRTSRNGIILFNLPAAIHSTSFHSSLSCLSSRAQQICQPKFWKICDLDQKYWGGAQISHTQHPNL